MRAQALVRFIIDFFFQIFCFASCLFIALHYHRHTSNVVVLLTISDINLYLPAEMKQLCLCHRFLFLTSLGFGVHILLTQFRLRKMFVCVCVFFIEFSRIKTARNQSFRILIEICPNSVHFVFEMHVNCIRILMCSASAISI